MTVKIFTSVVSNDDIENQISEWTKDLNPVIHSVKLDATVLHDYYSADHQTLGGMICNYWTEYTAVLIYESNK